MIKLKKLRFLIITFAVLGCVLLLASCKGTGKYYYRGNENNETIEITSSEWISTYKGQTFKYNIEWISDTVFKRESYLYYCDGGIVYALERTYEWYSKKAIEEK